MGMNWRKHLVEALTLIVAAALCAGVSNALAGRERKLALKGNYPNALKVPTPVAATTSTEPPPATVTDTAMTIEPAPTTSSATRTTVAPVTTTTVAPTATTAIATTATAPRTTTQPALPTPAPATPAPAAAASTKQYPPHADKEYIEIGYDDVATLHARNALFLDARRTSIYEQGHIAGARTFSVWESDIDEKVNNFYSERSDPRQQLEPIVIYCSGGDCEDSHMLARKLWGLQFNNIWVYKDGFPDWEKRGGKISRGPQP